MIPLIFDVRCHDSMTCAIFVEQLRLSQQQWSLLRPTARCSSHGLDRGLYIILESAPVRAVMMLGQPSADEGGCYVEEGKEEVPEKEEGEEEVPEEGEGTAEVPVPEEEEGEEDVPKEESLE